MTSLTVLYDEGCAFCRRCREWLTSERSYVPIAFVAAGSDEAHARFGTVPWTGAELVVISDEGEVWIGESAFLVCLWALESYRSLSYTLSDPLLLPFAGRFFRALSSQRKRLAAFFDDRRCESDVCTIEHRPVRGVYR